MAKQTLRFNFRLNPSSEQSELLFLFASFARGIWNLLLSETIRRYSHDKTFIFYSGMADLLRQLKQFEEFHWIKQMDSAAAQQEAKKLDQALRDCVSSKTRGFPKHKLSYKKKKLSQDSYRTVNNKNCIRIENGCITLPKIGAVPVVLHRPLVSQIKTVDLMFKHGHWYVSIVQEVQCKPEQKTFDKVIGIDLNSQNTVVSSNGFIKSNPKFLKQSKVKLAQLQRSLSRKKKGSNNWLGCRARLNKVHGKVQRQRLDFAHQLSGEITNQAGIVIAEDLNVRGMQQFNGPMVADNVFGLITGLLKYKSKLKGGIYHEIGRYEKSTGVCCHCQAHHSLSLKERTFTCDSCGLVQDRDLSSAIHIHRTGVNDLLSAGTVDRGTIALPQAQVKQNGKTKVLIRA